MTALLQVKGPSPLASIAWHWVDSKQGLWVDGKQGLWVDGKQLQDCAAEVSNLLY